MADLRSRSAVVTPSTTGSLNGASAPRDLLSSDRDRDAVVDVEAQQRERLLSGGLGAGGVPVALFAGVSAATGGGGGPSSAASPSRSDAPNSASKMSRYADMIGHKRLAVLREMGGQRGVAAHLNSDLSTGITAASVAQRIAAHGRNVLPVPEPQSLWDFIKESLEDRTMQILIGAAVLSLVLGMTTPDPRTGEVDRSTGWIEGFAILLSVAIVTLIGSLNNYQKQAQFSGIMEAADRPRPVPVVRDGVRLEVPSSEVVVGDLVRLHGGTAFSFDALLVSGDGFACDESNLTGEADRVAKTPGGDDPFLLSGTSVTDGCEGTALVVAVGASSFSGAIHAAVCEEAKDQTPLQEKLEGMADTIGKFGLVAAIITFVILTLKEAFHIFVLGHTFYAMKIFENVTTAVAIVVVAVPEGLPLSVTISLAYSMKRMLQDKNFVRHLSACETMGGATTICTDKTGTLTQSDMYLRALYLGGNLYDNLNTGGIAPNNGNGNGNGNGAPPAGSVAISIADDSTGSPYSASGLGLTSSSSRGGASAAVADWQLDASPVIVKQLLDCIAHNALDAVAINKTNAALSAALDGLKECYGYDALEAARTAVHGTASASGAVSGNGSTARVRFPFNSSRKQSSVVVKANNTIRHYVIGAAEMVLQRCTHVYTSSGAVEPLAGPLRAHYEAASLAMMGGGLRTLAVAVSEKTTNWGGLPTSPPEEPLRLIGFAGIEEPLRPEVPAAIATSYRAGIRVIMLTGDSLPTAVNIARRCGIRGVDERDSNGGGGGGGGGTSNSAAVMEGPVFQSLSDQEVLTHVLPRIAVLARASPLDKRRIVRLLKKNPNEVVAVTGDGTNDAPALKAADVGFAMNSGSDVAKRASDIVLLDDNYVGMVKATMWGRNVKSNIRKFIQFQLTVNVAACVVAIIGAILNSQNLSPLKPVQLLWLNLIMDTLAALALATELPSRSLLHRGVEQKDSSIVTPAMWLNVATQSAFQLFTQVVLLLGADDYFGVRPFSEDHLSLVFNVFVMMQIFNFFNARLLSGEHGLFFGLRKSTLMLAIVAVIFASQVLIIQFAGRFFSVRPLSVSQWGVSIAIGALSLPIGIATRSYQRRRGMTEVGGGEDGVAAVYDVLLGAYGRVVRLFRPRRRSNSTE